MQNANPQQMVGNDYRQTSTYAFTIFHDNNISNIFLFLFQFIKYTNKKKSNSIFHTLQIHVYLYILNNMETLKRMPFKARKAVFEKLEDIADVASMSPEDRERYDNSVKVYRDYLVTMDAAEQKGIKEGLEKGIEKGMKEGTQRAQLKIARNMKAKGIDNQSIAECTDLPLSIIEGL